MPASDGGRPAGDMLSLIRDFPFQLRESLTIGTEIVIRDELDAIVVAGMGGAGSAGAVLSSICSRDKIPILSWNGLTLPDWVNERTLVIVASYSGDTDETISMYSDATKKRCKILCITSGGRLARLAKQDGLQCVMIPRGLVSRGALGYFLMPMLTILSRSHIIDNPLDDFEQCIALLERAPYTTSAQNLARRLAGTIPLIYATPRLMGLAQRWKNAFNWSAKCHAFVGTLPEVAHSEILTFAPSKIPFHVIFLRDDRNTLPMKRRIEAVKTLLRNRGVQVTDIELKGASHTSKVLTAVHLGDLVSYYLAEDTGEDSMNTAAIAEYKAIVSKAEGQKQ